MPKQSLTPLDNMQRAIQLAAFHYIACLKATPTNADHKINFEKKNYIFEAIARSDSRELHIEFQTWASTSVLRDLVESFSTYLMDIYGESIRLNNKLNYSCTINQFERKGIEDQLIVLEKDFDISPIWTSRLTGYNRARNCLAHRQGIVGPRDTTDGNELVVRWLKSEIALVDGLPDPIIEIDGPMQSLAQAQHVHGSAAKISLNDNEKRILLGESLHFMPHEIMEICQTLQLASAAFSTLVLRT